jgi:rod shape determining protein RodA
MGWLNIYSSSLSSIEYIPETVSIYFIDHSFNFHNTAIDGKFYENMRVSFCCFFVIISWTFSFGKTIAGQRCWYALGSFTIQPSEFAKAATSLALAKFLSDSQINLKVNRQVQALAIVFYPYSLFFHNQTLVARSYSILLLFYIAKDCLPGMYGLVCHYCIICTNLSIRTTVRYIIGSFSHLNCLF